MHFIKSHWPEKGVRVFTWCAMLRNSLGRTYVQSLRLSPRLRELFKKWTSVMTLGDCGLIWSAWKTIICSRLTTILGWSKTPRTSFRKPSQGLCHIHMQTSRHNLWLLTRCTQIWPTTTSGRAEYSSTQHLRWPCNCFSHTFGSPN